MMHIILDLGQLVEKWYPIAILIYISLINIQVEQFSINLLSTCPQDY